MTVIAIIGFKGIVKLFLNSYCRLHKINMEKPTEKRRRKKYFWFLQKGQVAKICYDKYWGQW